MPEGSRKAVIAAFLANLGIAIAKFVGFLFTASAGLLAESVHSLADTGNQLLLIFGENRAQREPTAEHPFGYGRERFFWAFVVALVLFSMGGLFALYEGISKLISPHEPESFTIGLVILLVSVVLEGLSLRTGVHEAGAFRPRGTPWSRFIRRTKHPELAVVLLEDTGALVGLFFALAGIILAKITGNARWDAAGSIAIGVLLVVIAIVLAIEMKGLLIGESAVPRIEDQIVKAMEGSPEVRRLIHLRTEHLGPDDLLVAAKLEFDGTLTVAQLADAIDDVEARVRQDVPIARLMYLEPDVYRAGGPGTHDAGDGGGDRDESLEGDPRLAGEP
jgi:cation diffusion facilitator family transporter